MNFRISDKIWHPLYGYGQIKEKLANSYIIVEFKEKDKELRFNTKINDKQLLYNRLYNSPISFFKEIKQNIINFYKQRENIPSFIQIKYFNSLIDFFKRNDLNFIINESEKEEIKKELTKIFYLIFNKRNIEKTIRLYENITENNSNFYFFKNYLINLNSLLKGKINTKMKELIDLSVFEKEIKEGFFNSFINYIFEKYNKNTFNYEFLDILSYYLQFSVKNINVNIKDCSFERIVNILSFIREKYQFANINDIIAFAFYSYIKNKDMTIIQKEIENFTDNFIQNMQFLSKINEKEKTDEKYFKDIIDILMLNKDLEELKEVKEDIERKYYLNVFNKKNIDVKEILNIYNIFFLVSVLMKKNDENLKNKIKEKILLSFNEFYNSDTEDKTKLTPLSFNLFIFDIHRESINTLIKAKKNINFEKVFLYFDYMLQNTEKIFKNGLLHNITNKDLIKDSLIENLLIDKKHMRQYYIKSINIRKIMDLFDYSSNVFYSDFKDFVMFLNSVKMNMNIDSSYWHSNFKNYVKANKYFPYDFQISGFADFIDKNILNSKEKKFNKHKHAFFLNFLNTFENEIEKRKIEDINNFLQDKTNYSMIQFIKEQFSNMKYPENLISENDLKKNLLMFVFHNRIEQNSFITDTFINTRILSYIKKDLLRKIDEDFKFKLLILNKFFSYGKSKIFSPDKIAFDIIEKNDDIFINFLFIEKYISKKLLKYMHYKYNIQNEEEKKNTKEFIKLLNGKTRKQIELYLNSNEKLPYIYTYIDEIKKCIMQDNNNFSLLKTMVLNNISVNDEKFSIYKGIADMLFYFGINGITPLKPDYKKFLKNFIFLDIKKDKDIKNDISFTSKINKLKLNRKRIGYIPIVVSGGYLLLFNKNELNFFSDITGYKLKQKDYIKNFNVLLNNIPQKLKQTDILKNKKELLKIAVKINEGLYEFSYNTKNPFKENSLLTKIVAGNYITLKKIKNIIPAPNNTPSLKQKNISFK